MDRPVFCQKISRAFKITPIVAILGPRQCGKTTLARKYAEEHGNHKPENYFDLERPSDIARLVNAELTLGRLSGLIVIDEIQRAAELFPLLRVLADQNTERQQYLILGSASRELIKQFSESLAGRITYLELTPFNLLEAKALEKLWLRGGFPRSFLATDDTLSYQWRENYIRTFLEQDIPNLGIQIPANNLRRFWMMLAHYHGNIFNASELGKSLQLSHPTVQRYANILAGTFMMRLLPAWYENISKRQVKSPKIYFRDGGIYHALLGIQDQNALWLHPKLGSSWEGFALEEIIRANDAVMGECYFWTTQNNAELDLLLIKNGQRTGFEIKFTDSPKLTKSMRIAYADLKLDKLYVVYPGTQDFPLAENMQACGLTNYLNTFSTPWPP